MECDAVKFNKSGEKKKKQKKRNENCSVLENWRVEIKNILA